LFSEQLRRREAYPGFQIAEDLDFKQKDWIFQRAGWVAMALIIVAALTGLFSHGPLSYVKARDSADTIQVEYERFQRFRSPGTMNIEISNTALNSGAVRIFIDKEFAENFDIRSIYPEPQGSVLTINGSVFDFPVLTAPAVVSLDIAPLKRGSVSGHIGLEGEAPAEIHSFIYP
jgi:hypothetical protein